MKKIYFKILLILAVFIIAIPNISKAATQITVGQVKTLSILGQTNSTIKISWSKVDRSTSYDVEIWNPTAKKFELYERLKENTTTIKGLKSASTYTIRVRAGRMVNGKKYYGAYSAKIVGVTKPDRVKGLKATSITNKTATITWNKLSGVTAYDVYMWNNKQSKYVFYKNTTTNSMKIQNLTPVTTYKIKIVAYKTVNGLKYSSTSSEALEVVTIPSTVTNLRIIGNSSEKISIEWNKVEEATGYQIYKVNYKTLKWEPYKMVQSTNITVNKLDLGLKYMFRVRAYTTINGKKYYGVFSNTLKLREGIDISSYQEEINWEKVYNQGIRFAMFRAGGRYYGRNNGRIYEDKCIKYNIEQATKYGVEFGIYFFSSAITEEEAKEEANWCVQILKKYDISKKCKFIAHDFEVYKQGRAENITKDELNKDAIAFLTTVKQNGYTPVIYGSKYYLTTYFYMDNILNKINNCKVWLAHYTSNQKLSTYDGKYDMWQYTDGGYLEGINGKLDMDLIYF